MTKVDKLHTIVYDVLMLFDNHLDYAKKSNRSSQQVYAWKLEKEPIPKTAWMSILDYAERYSNEKEKSIKLIKKFIKKFNDIQ